MKPRIVVEATRRFQRQRIFILSFYIEHDITPVWVVRQRIFPSRFLAYMMANGWDVTLPEGE